MIVFIAGVKFRSRHGDLTRFTDAHHTNLISMYGKITADILREDLAAFAHQAIAIKNLGQKFVVGVFAKFSRNLIS